MLSYSKKDNDTDTVSTYASSLDSILILGEIVGATNLVAALRGEDGSIPTRTVSLQSKAPQPKNDTVNAFCEVYWGDDLIHQTKRILKNNNPIWACDTGSLFQIQCNVDEDDSNVKDLRIEVFDRVGKKEKTLLGVVVIPGKDLRSGAICNETRMTFKLRKDTMDILRQSKSQDNFTSTVWNSITAISPSVRLPWSGRNKDSPDTDTDAYSDSDSDDEMSDGSDDDSLYGRAGKEKDNFDPSCIDDDYIFGKSGTLALRFRNATIDDVGFLKAVSTYNQGFRYARKKKKESLAKVKKILESNMQRVAEIKAHIVSEKSTAYTDVLSCEAVGEMIDYRCHGRIFDKGVQRLRVKPGPDPNDRLNTKFLTKDEITERHIEPSKKWVEAGSGNIGQIKLEILSCEGLPNKDIGQMFGNKTDPFACIVYEDCLVVTDSISDCLNPKWMPWSQRAFLLNRMHELSCIYIGVFNHNIGPLRHTGCGRITVDLRDFKPNTSYTLKYELFSSPITTNRKSKGYITIRLELTDAIKRDATLSIIRPPALHVNVKRRKTLAIARYTIYGKYREDVYNLKLIRSYIDEFLQYLELGSFEVNRGAKSLILWRGQVQIGGVNMPLHSVLAFVSATYVIERPPLFPAYFFFCIAWVMAMLMIRQNRNPSPWFRKKALSHHLYEFVPLRPGGIDNGRTIEAHEGFEENKKLNEERKQLMEDDKMLQSKIAALRRELQQIFESVSDVSLDTYDNVGSLNLMNKLLPIQLILRDIMYYVRWIKKVVSCQDSKLSFLITLTCICISIVLFLLPITKVVHWAARIIIWVLFGPWMRLADMAQKRRKTMANNAHISKAMADFQKREQERFLDARKSREEALKLKATRILRFGRFAVKVPPINVTRFYDYPCPESTARPSDGVDNETIANCISGYVPGQQHYGVMIPNLAKPLKLINQKKKIKLKGQKTNGTESSQGTPNDAKHTVKEKHLKVKPTEATYNNPQLSGATEEGFEVEFVCHGNEYKSQTPKSNDASDIDERENTCIRIEAPCRWDSKETRGEQLQSILSDLTYDDEHSNSSIPTEKVNLTGKYKLVKNHNFIAFLKSQGVPALLCKVVDTIRPIHIITHEGATLRIQVDGFLKGDSTFIIGGPPGHTNIRHLMFDDHVTYVDGGQAVQVRKVGTNAPPDGAAELVVTRKLINNGQHLILTTKARYKDGSSMSLESVQTFQRFG